MTLQVPEELIYNGRKTFMISQPPMPKNHPRIIEDFSMGVHDRILTSACHRGYVGTWEIREGRLYLAASRGMYKIADNEPVFADWFTGIIRIPRGRNLEYPNIVFGMLYEREIRITIEKGVVVTTQTVDNRGKKLDPRIFSD